MTETPDFIDIQAFDALAEETGISIVFVDARSREVAAANNNSICRHLNPSKEFSAACARFCGIAFEKAAEAGGRIGFECHAGLECRAVLVRDPNKPLVAIVGRTFTKADNYRKATTRAIAGDWKEHSPADLFENVLLTGSSAVLDQTAIKLESQIAEAAASASGQAGKADRPETQPAAVATHTPEPAESRNEAFAVAFAPADPQQESGDGSEKASKTGDHNVAEARAWRSFFGSLLKTDYPKAAYSILEFLAHHYGFTALVWLESKDDRFENTVNFGDLKGRRVRLGIAPDDARLLEAAQNNMPLQLGERSKQDSAAEARIMQMFPISIGGQISAAIAILDPVDGDAIKRQIVRMCQSVAPQLEILRLRSEIAHGETLSTAVRRFSESLKRIDTDDLWLNLTQNAAEMLRAERASLLIYDDKSESLEIKAIVGSPGFPMQGEVGGRVSKIVFAKNETVAVSDVTRTGLPPAPAERRYKTGSFLSCPVTLSGRTIGVINFTDRAAGEPFDKGALEMFGAIAPQLAVAIDRASLKERAHEFEQLSVTDPLTGLLNRRYIEERVMEEIKRSNRHGFPMSFMMLDVDRFKTYNDQFGHPAGDEALKIVGSVIRDTLRGADVAARFGGEEFSILLPQTTGVEAAAIAERIRANIESAHFPHRKVTVSIGIASCSDDLCTAATIVSAADKALYRAKEQGRNKVLVYENMHLAPAEQQSIK